MVKISKNSGLVVSELVAPSVEENNGKTKAHVNHVKLEGGLGKTNVDCFLEKKDETFFKPVVEADVSMAKDVKGHTKVKCLTSMGKRTHSFHC